MSFLNPFLLIGLLAVAIPVVLHFINLRKPRQVAFSTIAFFTELRKSTLRRLNIKKLLLLAVRSLALIFLALALARPFLPAHFSGMSTDQGPVLYGLLIDNGPGMDRIDEKGPYIDQARDVAKSVINQAKNNDQFIIMPTHGEPEHTRAVNRQEAGRLLGDIEAVNKGAYPSEHLHTLTGILENDPAAPGVIYWISHGQKTHIDALNRNSIDGQEGLVPVQFVKIGEGSGDNTAVTSVRMVNQVISRNIPLMMEVEVMNYGQEPVYNQFLSLEADGRLAGEYQVELEAGQSEQFVFEVIPNRTGDVKGVARLEGDTHTFDNERYFSVNIPEARNILLVSDPLQGSDYRSYFKPVLEAASHINGQIGFSELSIDQLRDEYIEDYDAIILDGLTVIPEFLYNDLRRFVQQGKGLAVFPYEGSDLNSYNQFLAQFDAGSFTGMRGDYGRFEAIARFQPLVEGHPVVNEIFDKQDDEEIRITVPDVYYYWIYHTGERSRQNVIFNSNLNEPLLTEHRYGDGLLMVSSLGTDPGWSNFPVNPLFAPVFFRTALYAVSFEERGPDEHILGTIFNESYPFVNTDITMEINEVSLRPETAVTGGGIQLRYEAKEWEPGWAHISDGETEKSIAINQNISESDFTSLTIPELEESLGRHMNLLGIVDTYGMSADEINLTIESAGFGSEIWNWFIWTALVLLLAECLIAKRYKAETLS